MNNKSFQNPIKNQRGIIAFDTIIALCLAIGGTLVVFAISLSLTAIEVGQYVAFSVSRAYFSADVNPQAQEAKAYAKYEDIIKKAGIKAFASSDWFKFKITEKFNFNEDYSDVVNTATGKITPLYGIEIEISTKILSFSIPFFGRTTSDESLKTHVNSFLGREPSQLECWTFQEQRYQKFLGLSRDANYSAAINPNAYVPMVDNGC